MLLRAATLASAHRCFGCGKRGESLCSQCRSELATPSRTDPIAGVDRLSIPWAYEKGARDLVLALKLRARRPAAGVLAEAVAARVQTRGTGADAITWVPGRRKDTRVRGFDHAELIATELAARIGLPAVDLLERTMERPDQTTLSGPARRANLAGAFVARPGSERVMLVDDLVTTGATATACAWALRAAGATHVEVAAPCRA